MAVRITYFVHGTTTDNERGIATGWLPGELSLPGRKQARELGRLLAEESFDAVFSSDLQRAIESAELAFAGRYEVIHDPRLRECNYGELNGTPADAFRERLEAYIETPFSNGESLLDVEHRVASFLADLRRDHDGQRIAMVSHQAPQLALEVLLKGKTWPQAIAEDWRAVGSWQPGWEYVLT